MRKPGRPGDLLDIIFEKEGSLWNVDNTDKLRADSSGNDRSKRGKVLSRAVIRGEENRNTPSIICSCFCSALQ